MDNQVSILNKSTELEQYMDRWTYDEQRDCWCLEDILYTEKAAVPLFQRLSIFVPRAYLNEDGTINEGGRVGSYTAGTVPVVFENNAAGYSEMPHAWLGGPRCYADQYLKRGLIYVTVGCRGRESRDADGKLVGKAPITLVDLKTALRFLRHNRNVLPGDWDKVISVGWSAGGAMSSLLAVSGDHEWFRPYLQENGAFMDESDSVFAAQIYCPIVDLEHADQAYEWMFHADKENENTPAGAAEVMTPFKQALSKKLHDQYVAYFNTQKITDPDTGEKLLLNGDGRSGSAYDYLMMCLNRSATDFLTRLSKGELPQSYTVQDYLDGTYTFEKPAPPPVMPGKKNPFEGLPSLGHLLLRPSGEAPPSMTGLPGMGKKQLSQIWTLTF